MTRTDIINYLIESYNFKSYLEIGVNKEPDNFDHIKCQYRIGVDPNGVSSFAGTSDEFFENNRLNFDLIFIDGLHEEVQVTKDINNSLKFLNKNGIIVLHDCLPMSEEQQSEHYNGQLWSGTVWRSLAKLRMSRADLELKIVDTDWGCGILRVKDSNLYFPGMNETIDYNFYLRHRVEMFNIISIEEFYNTYR